jgi:hypothetical protein
MPETEADTKRGKEGSRTVGKTIRRLPSSLPAQRAAMNTPARIRNRDRCRKRGQESDTKADTKLQSAVKKRPVPWCFKHASSGRYQLPPSKGVSVPVEVP